MKTTLLTVILALLTVIGYTQSDTIYFDQDWKKCNRNNAKYYRLILEDGKKYIVKDMYINNYPQMIAVCSSVNPLIKDGKCNFFDESGVKTSEGTYTNNKESGIWIWWEDNGKDSTVAEYKSDGTRTYTRFSRNYMNKNDNGVYELVDEMPSFPGGYSEMTKFISKKFKLPKKDKKNGVKGIFYISFVVDEEGNIINPVIKKSISKTCDEEALRIMRKMPKWTPGKLDGKIVKVRINVPIRIK